MVAKGAEEEGEAMEVSEGGKCQDKLVSDRTSPANGAPTAKRKTTDAPSTTVETRLRHIWACSKHLNQIRRWWEPEDNNKKVLVRASTELRVGPSLLESLASSLKDHNSQTQPLVEAHQVNILEAHQLNTLEAHQLKILEDRNRTTVTSSSKGAALWLSANTITTLQASISISKTSMSCRSSILRPLGDWQVLLSVNLVDNRRF